LPRRAQWGGWLQRHRVRPADDKRGCDHREHDQYRGIRNLRHSH